MLKTTLNILTDILKMLNCSLSIRMILKNYPKFSLRAIYYT